MRKTKNLHREFSRKRMMDLFKEISQVIANQVNVCYIISQFTLVQCFNSLRKISLSKASFYLYFDGEKP